MADHLLSTLTVCGLAELDEQTGRGVTDVLTILDPDMPDPASFSAWPAHRRTVLRFHDDIEPMSGRVLPTREDVDAILAYGRNLTAHPGEKHLLVHCHMGMSRSTAAMTMILAQAEPQLSGGALFERILSVRRRAWPNLLMIGMAEEALGRKGEFVEPLRKLYGLQLVTFPHLGESLRAIGRGREVDMAIRA